MRKDCWITLTMYLEEGQDDDGDVDEEQKEAKDKDDDLLCGLLLAGILLEPHLQLLDGLAPETGQARVQHQLQGDRGTAYPAFFRDF